MTTSKTFVALLRGINVGGKSLISMAELRALLSSLGFEDVVTYIQSGNVVFRSAIADEAAVAAELEREIAGALDVSPSVLLRTPGELETIAASNPFLSRKADVTKLHVVFLDRAPAASAAAELDPERSPPDEFALKGRDLFLHLPNGAGRSKLTLDYLERVLGVRGTQRNWKTLLELLALMQR
ncbi:MAG TPA: DUF1697 domain-containing protein [Gaiellaceae bacterium]|nr:DUF1697 domain-containing protein [Gaiellaceae bacterium]